MIRIAHPCIENCSYRGVLVVLRNQAKCAATLPEPFNLGPRTSSCIQPSAYCRCIIDEMEEHQLAGCSQHNDDEVTGWPAPDAAHELPSQDLGQAAETLSVWLQTGIPARLGLYSVAQLSPQGVGEFVSGLLQAKHKEAAAPLLMPAGIATGALSLIDSALANGTDANGAWQVRLVASSRACLVHIHRSSVRARTCSPQPNMHAHACLAPCPQASALPLCKAHPPSPGRVDLPTSR